MWKREIRFLDFPLFEVVLAFLSGLFAVSDTFCRAMMVAGEAVDAISLPLRSAVGYHDIMGWAYGGAASAACAFFRVGVKRLVGNHPHECRIYDS